MKRKLAAILAADMVGYSRLIEMDESATLARQKQYRKSLIDPAIAEHNGRIVKTTGDGMLVEFQSAMESVRCAMAIQAAMQEQEGTEEEARRIIYRIGINVGDVLHDEEDIFGDGVNVAARLESLAEPGGVCIADSVHQTLQGGLDRNFRDLGSHKVKNISRPIKIWQWSPESEPQTAEEMPEDLVQRIGFAIAPDGVQLAYASVGAGPPLLKAPNWLNHLEHDWRSPIWGPALIELAKRHRLVRFDQRGSGLSDWDVDVLTESAMISDMDCVAKAAQIEPFALFGISQGCAFSVRYTAEHPDKVSHLILLNGYLRGARHRGSKEQTAIHEATNTLIREGWGSSNPTFRHLFTEAMMYDASPEQKSGFDELQRLASSAENAARINEMNGDVDVQDYARRVTVPTLVMHCEGDRRVPVEEGRRVAAMIPNARFVSLPGNNHALIDGSPAFTQFFEEFDRFTKEVAAQEKVG